MLDGIIVLFHSVSSILNIMGLVYGLALLVIRCYLKSLNNSRIGPAISRQPTVSCHGFNSHKFNDNSLHVSL